MQMSELILASRALGPIGANCYVIGDPVTRLAAVIDPGAGDPWIHATVRQHGLKVQYILLTHSHGDHIMGIDSVHTWSRAPVAIHGAEAEMLADPMRNFSALMGQPTAVQADRLLKHGDTLALGELRIEVRHTPGHSPGGVSFYLPAQGLVFSGDALFAGSVGRTDIPGAEPEKLVPGIKAQLLTLPGETTVYPGHGPATTVADEAEYNPFLA